MDSERFDRIPHIRRRRQRNDVGKPKRKCWDPPRPPEGRLGFGGPPEQISRALADVSDEVVDLGVQMRVVARCFMANELEVSAGEQKPGLGGPGCALRRAVNSGVMGRVHSFKLGSPIGARVTDGNGEAGDEGARAMLRLHRLPVADASTFEWARVGNPVAGGEVSQPYGAQRRWGTVCCRVRGVPASVTAVQGNLRIEREGLPTGSLSHLRLKMVKLSLTLVAGARKLRTGAT